jgi:hypothetical protein
MVIHPFPIISLRYKKIIITVIMNSGNRDSRHTVFKEINILPLESHMFSLSLFVVKIRELYISNSDIVTGQGP